MSLLKEYWGRSFTKASYYEEGEISGYLVRSSQFPCFSINVILAISEVKYTHLESRFVGTK